MSTECSDMSGVRSQWPVRSHTSQPEPGLGPSPTRALWPNQVSLTGFQMPVTIDFPGHEARTRCSESDSDTPISASGCENAVLAFRIDRNITGHPLRSGGFAGQNIPNRRMCGLRPGEECGSPLTARWGEIAAAVHNSGFGLGPTVRLQSDSVRGVMSPTPPFLPFGLHRFAGLRLGL